MFWSTSKDRKPSSPPSGSDHSGVRECAEVAGDADEAAKERAETDPPPTDPDGSTPDGSAETPTTGTHDPLPRRQRRTPPELSLIHI